MSRGDELKVAIDAQIMPGTSGGVSTAVKSLIRDLGRLDDGNEQYLIVIGSEEGAEWLKPIVGPNQQFAIRRPWQKNVVSEDRQDAFRALLKRTLGPLLPAARYVRGLINIPSVPSIPKNWPEVPLSDGFWESLGCNLVHFTTQSFTLCSLPSIYNPHDLQHLHYPIFWPPEIIAWRETIYPAGCHFAHTVVVGSQWIKEDVIRQYRIHHEKVQVIPEGPPTHSDPEPTHDILVKVKNKYQLDEPFALYPAVTWPHKNHILLLEALAHLREAHGMRIPLVCTGSPFMDFWPRIERRVFELNLQGQVKFLGFVPEEEIRAIYRLSQFLVQPSLFEASSLPIFEAWLEGTPVMCSNVTALPDQVSDAALLFDPNSVESISDAMAEMVAKDEVRQELRERGFKRLRDFDCERTAKAYRAVYRRAAGFPLTEEDRWLLKWDWMRKPKRKEEN